MLLGFCVPRVLSIESQTRELKDLAAKFNLPVAEVLTESKSAKEPGRSVFNTATVTVNNQATYRKGDYYRGDIYVDNSTSLAYQGITNIAVITGGTEDIVTNKTGNLFVPQAPETFKYDADGNLTNDGRWSYSWDAEI